MTKLDQLHLEKSKKFAEICALVACELGYGELAAIKSEARHHVEREAAPRITDGKRLPSSELGPIFARSRHCGVY
jgi:hypothetical protein